MTKRIVSALLIFVMIVFGATSAFAAEEKIYVVDAAVAIEGEELLELQEKLQKISEKHEVDVAAAVIISLDGVSIESYAKSIYEASEYGKDGILLLYATYDKEVYIYTKGTVTDAIDKDAKNDIIDKIASDLKAGDIDEAFEEYAEMTDKLIDKHNSFDYVTAIIISVIIGIVFALIVTGTLKGQLKTVRARNEAADYQRPGSFELENSKDYFIYSKIDKTRIESKDSKSSDNSDGVGRKL